jgi:adenosylmethionine-8-amino-7-oxononanoate aminotransferase
VRKRGRKLAIAARAVKETMTRPGGGKLAPFVDYQADEEGVPDLTRTFEGPGDERVPARSRYWPPHAVLPTDRDEPFVLSRGLGSLVWDTSGKEYVDATASLWYSLVGHGRRELADAAHDQMLRLDAYYTHGDYATPATLRLAERVCELSPVDDPLVMLNSGGSDAIETAAKLARRYWNVVGKPSKVQLLHREFSYHGLHGLATELVGLRPLREGFGATSLDDFDPLPVNDAQALEERILRLGPDRVAAFFVEPVIGAGGVIPPAPGYLEEAQRICREHDVLLVIDEVVTGFGRLGRWFGSSIYGLSPDMLCFAKGVTSGYVPLGGVIASKRVWGPFVAEASSPVFHHGYTYSGHPTACAVGLANLEVLEHEDLISRASEMAAPFAEAVSSLETHGTVKEVRTAGLMAAVDLDTAVLGEAFPAEVAQRARELGVLVRVMFGGSLQISPPLVIEPREIQRIVETLRTALTECEAESAVGSPT